MRGHMIGTVSVCYRRACSIRFFGLGDAQVPGPHGVSSLSAITRALRISISRFAIVFASSIWRRCEFDHRVAVASINNDGRNQVRSQPEPRGGNARGLGMSESIL